MADSDSNLIEWDARIGAVEEQLFGWNATPFRGGQSMIEHEPKLPSDDLEAMQIEFARIRKMLQLHFRLQRVERAFELKEPL